MASQQPSPPQLQSPSPPLPHSTTPSKPLDKNTKTQGKPLQEIQSTSYHPISPSTTNTILTITFLALITILSIIHLIHQSTANVFEISNIFLLSPILSIISIAALLWRKYKSWRVRRMILDEEEAVGWMDEDETLEEGGELYAVGWEDGSRDTHVCTLSYNNAICASLLNEAETAGSTLFPSCTATTQRSTPKQHPNTNGVSGPLA
ncbi:beta-ketoacyl synthase [Stemphylium lycopersici]|uniref:Beta-ketoacyl synthase n=1 Tax=Stemphylium lycopersici TaxID=183478 RepID=A0A364N8I0_STELY|nr:beta-ketoacyl synthase [Stemphylium lycopersici]